MRLSDIVTRAPSPTPWAEGDNIPWFEPGFSRRMLAEHLSQDHDAASRRAATIDQHVALIHSEVLERRPTRVLDLGCGPGLYTERLARLGHLCRGIDWSPAPIAYARERAERDGLPCEYTEGDVRTTDPGGGYGLAMMVYGEFNVFRPEDARRILATMRRSLAPGGRVLLEPHTYEAVHALGLEAPRWSAHGAGLFSDGPHLLLRESAWDDAAQAATTRHYVVDAATSEVARHASSMQAYTRDKYEAVLSEAGFVDVRLFPSLAGAAHPPQPALIAVVARAPAAHP